MINHNRYKCSKNPTGNYNACLSCWEYKKGRCSPIELELFRQTDTGYEIYYPHQKLFREVAKFLGISTKEILERLSNNYGLNIERTTLLKYHKMGLLEQEQKIGRGKSKGVVSMWSKDTDRKFYFINKLKDKGIRLEEFKKYQDILDLKYPEILKKYRGFPLNVMVLDDADDVADVVKFFTVAATLAAVTLKIDSPSNYGSEVIIDEDDISKSKIEITLVKEVRDKKVVFSKEGVKVIEAA